MAGFVEVAELDKVSPGRGVPFTVNSRNIALFNVDGTIYAIDDNCLHKGAPLSNGKLNGVILTCTLHGWRYNVTTGFDVHFMGFHAVVGHVRDVNGKILVAI